MISIVEHQKTELIECALTEKNVRL